VTDHYSNDGMLKNLKLLNDFSAFARYELLTNKTKAVLHREGCLGNEKEWEIVYTVHLLLFIFVIRLLF